MFNHWSTPIHHEGHLYGMFSFKKYGEGPLQCIELNPVRSSGARTVTAGQRHPFRKQIDCSVRRREVAVVEASPSKYKNWDARK